jgi:hypothetical protein
MPFLCHRVILPESSTTVPDKPATNINIGERKPGIVAGMEKEFKMFKRILHIFVFTAVLASLLATAPVKPARAAGVIYVKANAAGSNNGSSWANAYTSLQDAIAAASSGDQIWVAVGTYKPTTGTSRFISFTLKNGVAIYGGFVGTETLLSQRNWQTNVSILSGDIGTVGDSSDNSYNVVNGGGTNSTAVLDGFTVTAGNADFNGGGMYNVNSSPTLTNLLFSANSAVFNGGGMHNDNSSPSLMNVTFNGNTAQYGGGMHNLNSSPTLMNITFSGNSANGAGGGLYNGNSSPTLSEVTFSDNSANGVGGGGGMYNLNSAPSLNNVTFSDNTASGAGGGGMHNNNGSPTLTNVLFSYNSATGPGGGINNTNNSNPNLTDVIFSGNSANDGGGMAGGGGLITNVVFTDNIAATSGGGMYLNDASPTLSNVDFISNSAEYGGGMCNFNNSNPTLTDVTFSYNSSDASGGGMFNNGSSSPTLTNVDFISNSALSGGGMANSNGSNPTLTDVIFSNNSAANQGGGMSNFNNSNPTLENVTLSGNSAAVEGGGMNNFNSSPTLTNITFSSNTASLYGGGMHNNNSNPILMGVTFSNNSAEIFGGGMYNYNGSSPTLTNVIFNGNSTNGNSTNDSGGGMFNNSSSPTLTDVIFNENSTSGQGGGMNNANDSNPSMTRLTFSNNSADNGGGMHNTSSSPSLTNVTFSGNSALVRGGGMVNLLSSPTLTNITISGNSAAVEGGGMFNNGGNPVITNSILYNNIGGEIVGSGTPVVTYSIVQGGYAGTGNLDADPLLGPLADNGGFTQTMAPGLGSPAVDWAANAASCPSHDQRGVPRPQGWGCDLGAFERYFEVLSITRNDPSPTASQQVTFTVTFSQTAHNVDVTDFKLTTTGVTGASIINVSNNDDLNFDVTVNTGTGSGTIRLDLVNDGSIANDWSQYLGIGITTGDFTSGEVYTVDKTQTATIPSTAAQDGWILESTETSGVGGKLNKGATTLRLGDDAANRQYRAILSFDTSSLPEGADITSVTLTFKYAGKSGTLPFNTHGKLLADIHMEAFKNNPALQLGDFKAGASRKNVLAFTKNKVNNWYSQSLDPLDFQFINTAGVTQFRLRFKLDDNNDFGADFLKIYSGDANEANRPQLIVEYELP